MRPPYYLDQLSIDPVVVVLLRFYCFIQSLVISGKFTFATECLVSVAKTLTEVGPLYNLINNTGLIKKERNREVLNVLMLVDMRWK